MHTTHSYHPLLCLVPILLSCYLVIFIYDYAWVIILLFYVIMWLEPLALPLLSIRTDTFASFDVDSPEYADHHVGGV